MFRYRPAPSAAEGLPDWASGTCSLARQSQLLFGCDRRNPVEWRPSVSLARREDRIVVLPATTRRDPSFFHLAAGQCFLTRKRDEPERDSYLCPRYESLPLSGLIAYGVLPHAVRVQIAHWLRDLVSKRP